MIDRFDGLERIVHWVTAVLMIVLLATGSILYIPSLMLQVGHRAVIANIHVFSGLALLAPIAIGLAGPWRGALLSDVRRLDRWLPADFGWFRGREHRLALRVGKFNGGQKLSAAIFAGAMVGMLVTGIVMRWSPPFPVDWATGATLVHDIGYIVLFAIVVGHVAIALGRPEQMRSMLSGKIPQAWAERHAPAWLDGTDLGPRSRLSRPGRSRARPRPRPNAPRDEAAPRDTTPVSG
ncbi:MAG: cytochrome b/b6 domain-containing protein [Acidimicrobiales bacterium]